MERCIAENRTANFVIVTAEGAPASEQYAADELRYYLERMTAAPITVTTDVPSDGRMFAIGRQASEALGVSDDELGEDGFLIRTVGAAIAVTGGKRGVIYGVYELLERLGCRFFTANCEQVPTRPVLTVPDLDIRQVPVLEYRDHNYYEPVTQPCFAVKLRLNGASSNIPEKCGGHLSYVWFCHTFANLVPEALYAESHPEYFSLRDGKRVTDPRFGQLCLTNPDVLKIAIENVRKALRAHPEARIISITQNDNNASCQCDACRASDEAAHSPAGTMLRFVNAIAEQLEPEFPDIIFDTFAYTYTRPVPTGIRPRHNVCVRLCSIEACFSHPFETCDEERGVRRPDGSRSSFIRDLTDWGLCCDRLYIWDYTTCFAHYPTPHPNWRCLQPNMRAFVRNHVRGVFEQANGASRGGTDLNELRAYVLAKLMWDAETDVDRHIREFTDAFYGAAAPYIRQYMDVLCDTAEQENLHVGFNDNPDSPLFRNEILDRLDALLEQAEQAVAGDPLRFWRVGKVRLSVRWVRLKRKTQLENDYDPEEINQFFADWQAYGLTRIDEWVSRETTHKALLRGLWRGTSFYEHWAGEGAEQL